MGGSGALGDKGKCACYDEDACVYAGARNQICGGYVNPWGRTHMETWWAEEDEDPATMRDALYRGEPRGRASRTL